MSKKAPYKLTIKLTSARPDAIGDALARLQELGEEFDQTGEASATLTMEAFQRGSLDAIREQFELWLYRYEIGIECDVTAKSPGVRPETAAMLRAVGKTPMDKIAGFVNTYGVERVEADE
jgi:hypothetical protein